LTETSKV